MPGESVDVGGGQDTAVTAQGAAGWCEARQGRRGIYSSKGTNIFPHQIIARYKYSSDDCRLCGQAAGTGPVQLQPLPGRLHLPSSPGRS